MRYLAILFMLASCDQTEIVGCPEVHYWSQTEQTQLLEEQKEVETTHPMIRRALTELYEMRVESRPCALLSRPVPK